MRSRWGCVVSAMVVLSHVLSAQVVQVRPIDIAGAIRSGTIRITVAPPSGVDSLKPFDSDPYTFLTRQKTDSLTITLESDSIIQFEKSKVFFFTNGSWTLECANTLSDLASRSGSYVKLAEDRAYAFNTWDSLSFSSKKAKVIRLRAINRVDSIFMLGTWTLERTVRFTSLWLIPNPVRIVPGATLQMQAKILDERKNLYPYFLGGTVTWRSSNSSVASIDENGKVTGVALGTALISASNSDRTLTGYDSIYVVSDFRPERAKPLTVKVALVIEDPVITYRGFKRIHELHNWRDPTQLANRLIAHFREVTDSVLNFQFVAGETYKDNNLFTRYYGNFLRASQYDSLLNEPGWGTLKQAADSGKLWFDYREFVKFYGFDAKRNNGEIDEVWVFAAPYLGMYESQLMGPNAFWWNSPPIKDGTALAKLLSVMGLNYERGVDQAFHSFGHRTESAIVQAYYQAQGRTWNPKSTNPTPWDLFTRIDKDMPGQAHVGNIHYPPNGASDYDYGNTRIVRSFAENWLRYPYLLDQSSDVNVDTWYYTQGDPLAEGQDHIGYLRWWYGHLPRYAGVSDGVLNNWWHYVVDHEAAVELAKVTPVVGVNNQPPPVLPVSYSLEQNFPNPFNPVTTIQFNLPIPGQVSLRVFDVMGREIATLAEGTFRAGRYETHWNAQSAASGVYFYRLQSRDFVETKPMVLIK